RTFELFRGGKQEEAFDLFDAYLPVVRYEQQPGIGLAIRKAVLHRRGIISSPMLRPPGARLSTVDQAELDAMLKRLERRLGESL
ncbi:MAG: dihydrodipicolinate synthase family protein, partial [Geminicoccaceae bacterium]|nr:dihydrodipicolinate synthase family protein [Geminicoccaceae bacterium]